MKVTMQKFAAFATALLLAAFALPGTAATKSFSVSVSQTGAMSWQLTYTNGSQGGGSNSNINSVNFTAPVDVSGVRILAPYPTSNTAYLCDGVALAVFSCAAGHVVGITWINGIPPNGGSALVNVTTGTAPTYNQQSCTNGLSWSAQAFTGNALGGTNFQPVVANATSTVACVLQFVTQPANAQAIPTQPDPTISYNITSVANMPNGTPPVQVQALVGGSPATFSVAITLTPNAVPPTTGTPTITGGSASASGATATASFGDSTLGSPNALTLNAIGTYTLTASAPAGSGFTSATSNPFTMYDGTLNCGQSLASSFTNPTTIAPDQPGYATGNRNAYNKDGVKEQCVPVLYSFTNAILTNNQVHLAWDFGSQPNAAFMFSVNWQLSSVVASNPGNVQPSPIGWPVTPRPKVAWLNMDGSNASVPGTPAFIPGLACLSGKLPFPYGTLSTQVNPGDTTITVTGILANSTAYGTPAPGAPAIPAFPFPVVIANSDPVTLAQTTATERMTAQSMATISPVLTPAQTKVYTGTYDIKFNVTRGGDVNGGSNPNATHAAGLRVMSTPLPIIPNDATTFPTPYQVKKQAMMCIAEHGFDSFSMVIDPVTGLPTAKVMYFTTFIDEGEGWGQSF